MSVKSSGLAQKPPIDDFNGYYEFLNNDFPTWVQYEGIYYPNLTTAFQAARTTNLQLRKKISQMQNYDDFKVLVSTIKNPQNWNSNRYKVMEKLVRDKFKRNRQISAKLASTEDRKLYNCYKTLGENQMYWGAFKSDNSGKTQYKGTNSLGKILEIVRGDIIKMQDTQKWLSFQNLQQDPQLYPEVALTVLKQSQPIDKLLLQKQNYFLFGSHPKCHFKLQHPSISKFHTGVYFSDSLQVIIVDMNSTHGTFVLKKGQTQKVKLEPLQKRSLQNGDTIFFGMSSRTYLCSINFQKVELVLKKKQQEVQKNVKQLQQVNQIASTTSAQQIKSKIGYKHFEGLHVQNINRNYTYNDMKQLFQKYGKVEKIRMLQNYKNGRFQGQVFIIYEQKRKIESILKEIRKSEDKQFQNMEIKAVDQYDMDKIFESKKRDDNKDEERGRDKDKERQYDRQRKKDRKRSRSREKKEKHKRYDKY